MNKNILIVFLILVVGLSLGWCFHLEKRLAYEKSIVVFIGDDVVVSTPNKDMDRNTRLFLEQAGAVLEAACADPAGWKVLSDLLAEYSRNRLRMLEQKRMGET